VRSFQYERPANPERAAGFGNAGKGRPESAVMAAGQFIAGGTNILDLMKLDVVQPASLVDVNGAAHNEMRRIETGKDGLRLGALVRMADAENHPHIKANYPVIADALRLAASPQIRNMATLGGNVLQRTRCEYFRETSWPCNKRNPGSGCSALEGVNRQHAILGASENCIATYPGDFAQALIALDASVQTITRRSARTIKFAALHRPPGTTPHIETSLEPGELITAIYVPAGAWTARSRYVKIRDREAYQFALASAAVALAFNSDKVSEARIALGGVATVPWRARAAERLLLGQVMTDAVIAQAADAAFSEAKTYAGNAFKLPLGKQTLIRALVETRDMKV